jgi:GPN-loop GTPase
MLQLDLPTLHVLTKIDNLSSYPSLPFNLDFYTEVHDLEYLLPFLDAEMNGKQIGSSDEVADDETEEEGKFTALNRAITTLVNDFGLVGFEPLCVEDKATMASLLAAADKACGHVFAATNADNVWQIAVNSGSVGLDIRDIQERWIDRRTEMDELEKEAWKREGDEWKGNGQDQDGHAENEADAMDEDLETWKSAAGDSGVKIVRSGANT